MAGATNAHIAMSISSIPSQTPVLVLPHQEAGKKEFAESRRFNPSLVGLFAIITLFCVTLLVFGLLESEIWHLGVIIAIGFAGLFLLLPLNRRRHSS